MMTSRPFSRSLRSCLLLIALLSASCGDDTVPVDDDDDPVPGYPIVMRIVDAVTISEIQGVVLQGDEWNEVGVVLDELSFMTRGMLSTDIDRLKAWGLDITLLSPATWQYSAAPSLAPAPLERENNRFVFANPAFSTVKTYAYGDTTGFSMPMIVYYGESDDTGYIGGVSYDRDGDRFGELDLEGFASNGTDTLFYRTYELIYHPE